MNIDLKSVHHNLSEEAKEFVLKKLSSLDTFEQHIENFKVTITKEHEHYIIEAHIHLHWKKDVHIKEEHEKLYPAVEFLSDKLYASVNEERNKMQKHHK